MLAALISAPRRFGGRAASASALTVLVRAELAAVRRLLGQHRHYHFLPHNHRL
jgi:hypothetical protein